MNIVIIEDEMRTANDLRESIEMARAEFRVKAILDSVEAALEWFSKNEPPDLIFSDIQLGDGLAFDIFRKIDIGCPVIFCTAYDEYAIEAFQNNGIDYLLKPVNEIQLEKSMAKIDLFKNSVTKQYSTALLAQLLRELENKTKNYKTSFLVSYRDKMIPVNIQDIALFSTHNDLTYLHTKDNKQYQLNYSLEHLEKITDPILFYRANRQILLAYNAIKEVAHYFDRKLLIKLTQPNAEPVSISKAKASDFLRWMENR
jgi:DNA-binding LytR/AlgR family response regulator